MKKVLYFLKVFLIIVVLLIVEILLVSIGALLFGPNYSTDVAAIITMVLWLITIIGVPIYFKLKPKKTGVFKSDDLPIFESQKEMSVPEPSIAPKVNNAAKKDQNVKEYDFCAIDFETANDLMISACSVGIVAVKDNQIVKEYYSLINPPVEEFNAVNIRIHGIRKDDVVDQPQFPVVWDSLKEFITNSSYTVAHNVGFDMSVLKESLLHYNLELIDFDFFDSMTFCSRNYDGKSKKLSDMCEYYKVNLDDHHNAIADAKACAMIVIEAVNQSRFKSVQTFLNGFYSVSVSNFSTFKSQSKFIRKPYRSKESHTEIKPQSEVTDSSHPLCNQNCVITGEFENFDRNTMMQMIVDVGGIIKSGVSRNTNYLIVGQQNKDVVGEDGLSGKQEKAIALIDAGHPIKIINEIEFLDYFK